MGDNGKFTCCKGNGGDGDSGDAGGNDGGRSDRDDGVKSKGICNFHQTFFLLKFQCIFVSILLGGSC